MARNEKRIAVTLACEDCKRRNYITMKNKVNDRERIELKKYCRFDRRHTARRRSVSVVALPTHAQRTSVRWTKGSSSIGRAPVSKTGGWGFKSLLPCKRVVRDSTTSTRVMSR